MKSIILKEEDEKDNEEKDKNENQLPLLKMASHDITTSLDKKKENKTTNDLNPSLFEIKEENEENAEKDKKNNKEDEKKVILLDSKPSLAIPKNVKDLRKVKTDGNLEIFAGGADKAKAAEERKNRLVKRLNKAKEVNKKNAEKNKYRKSVDISNMANLLQQQLNDKKEDPKDN